MHAILMLLGLWAGAFVTLGIALVALNIYSNVIDYGFELKSVGKEAALAAVCSLIEAASVWVVITYLPAAARALFIPFLLVALVYSLAHLEDWNRFDGVIVMAFQLAIAAFFTSLFMGNLGAALLIAIVVAGVLAVFASFAKSL